MFSNFENTFAVKYIDLTKFTYTLSIWYKMVKFLFKAVVHKLLASKKVDYPLIKKIIFIVKNTNIKCIQVSLYLKVK